MINKRPEIAERARNGQSGVNKRAAEVRFARFFDKVFRVFVQSVEFNNILERSDPVAQTELDYRDRAGLILCYHDFGKRVAVERTFEPIKIARLNEILVAAICGVAFRHLPHFLFGEFARVEFVTVAPK